MRMKKVTWEANTIRKLVCSGRKALMSDYSGNHFRDEKLSLQDLFGDKTLEELLHAIARVTGLGIVISDYAGRPISDMVNFKPFCQAMRKKEACQLSDASGIAQAVALKKHFIYCCPCGLLEVVIPIVIDDQYLGGFLAGQVRCDSIPEGVPVMQVPRHSMVDYQNNSDLQKEYLRIPKSDFKTFHDFSELIYQIVTLLAEKTHASIRNFRHEKDLLVQENTQLRYENLALHSRMDALNQSYDPLFCFNILTDISNLIYLGETRKAYDVINKFSSCLRDTVEDNVEIRQEEEYLKNYFELYKLRYEDNLNFTISVDEEMEAQRIPSRIIMPFLKQSLYELMEWKIKGLSIIVNVGSEKEEIVITIQIEKKISPDADQAGDGVQSDSYRLDKEERNTIKRMRLLYDTDYHYSIKNISKTSYLIEMRFPGAWEGGGGAR